MVGGGRDAFIGAVHRMAAQLDHQAVFVAGALSSTPEKSLDSGRILGLADDRNYPTWQAMLDTERARAKGDRIDFVSIVTPNDSHFGIAHAFAEAGFNVVLDKPMVHSSEQAHALIRTVERTGVVFGVTYNYSGYPMVKQARHLVAAGDLGDIRKVVVEYNQGWLATNLETSGQKQAAWRTDPARSGLGGAVGDIGSHAEQLACYVTGLTIESVCADLTSFSPGRRLDDDANILLRFSNGARGVMIASQIEIGHENDLRIRVYGSLGSLEWRQEDPNTLMVRSLSGPETVFRRGNAGLCAEAAAATRLPAGHPEAFIEAFANVYRGVFAAIRGEASALDFPTVWDGARGVAFIEAAVRSGAGDDRWTTVEATFGAGR